MFQFNYNPLRRALLYLNKTNTVTITISKPTASASATPKCYLFLLQHKHHPSPIPINFFSTASASDQQPFVVSYLTNKCGFSQEAALKAYKRVHFDTPQKPDSVLAFFRSYGFSNSQINDIISRAPELLTCDPNKRVLPKFEFLASKGASHSGILHMVTRSPRFLRRSLENHIVPMFELVRRFFPSDDKAIACIISCPTSIGDARLQHNVKLLLNEGLTDSSIHYLISTRAYILSEDDLRKTVEEVKQLGFDPSQLNFSVALRAKMAVTKSRWDAKVEALKTWGWSEEEFFDAFRRHPQFMLRSKDKLNAVMSFWIGQLGWGPSALRGRPALFGFSLEKRLIPRASVIQYLLSKGLMKKNASLATPFGLTEKLFLQKFVTCFKEDDTSRLLKLYQGGC